MLNNGTRCYYLVPYLFKFIMTKNNIYSGLSGSTRVITKNGQKIMANVSMDDELLVFNLGIRQFEYHKPKQVIHYTDNNVNCFMVGDIICGRDLKFVTDDLVSAKLAINYNGNKFDSVITSINNVLTPIYNVNKSTIRSRELVLVRFELNSLALVANEVLVMC